MATSTQQKLSESVEQRGDCPECNGDAITEGTEKFCADCGLVIDTDDIDHGQEWRAYDATDQSKIRASPTNEFTRGQGLGTKAPDDDGRLGLWHKRVRADRKERSRGYATSEIRRICANLDVPQSLCDQARQLFGQFHDAQSLEGCDLDAVAGGAALAVCRVHQQGVTAGDMSDVARSSERQINRRMKDICRKLGLETPPPDPRQRIRIVATEADLSDAVRDAALERFDAIDETLHCRASPSVWAGYLLWDESPEATHTDADEGVSQREVAEAAGITPAGIRRLRDKMDA